MTGGMKPVPTTGKNVFFFTSFCSMSGNKPQQMAQEATDQGELGDLKTMITNRPFLVFYVSDMIW
jgi:hypothetical protein